MSVRSPKGRELAQFTGSPSTIEADALQLQGLGQQMSTTAQALEEIANSEVHKSKGTDALAEQADEVRGDLAKAAIRYEGTGDALYPYGDALRTARLWYTANAESVRDAETRYQEAKSAWDSGVSDVDAGDTSGADELGDKNSEMQDAKSERDDWWSQYDTVFDDWEDAYDAAADGVAEAMDEADNDDSWWDWVSDALSILGWVIVALAIVAIFVVAQPWAAILLGTMAALSALHLAGTIYLYANGKASMSDIIWSAVGLLTCGLGGAFMKFGKSALPAMDDMVRIAQAGAGPRIGSRIAQMPGIFSRHGWTALTRGDDAARMLTFLDDVARLGGKLDNTLLARIGTTFAEIPTGAPRVIFQTITDITGLAVGMGSGRLPGGWSILPTFGRP